MNKLSQEKIDSIPAKTYEKYETIVKEGLVYFLEDISYPEIADRLKRRGIIDCERAYISAAFRFFDYKRGVKRGKEITITKKKKQVKKDVCKDVEEWLAAGNKPTQLPSYTENNADPKAQVMHHSGGIL